MTDQAYLLAALLMTASASAGTLGFAVARLTGRARPVRGAGQHSQALLASALEDGLSRLKAQQKEMSARAEASERLNSQIVSSLTAGLLLVESDGTVALLNPAGARLLGLSEEATGATFQSLLTSAPALADLITECRASDAAIVRQTIAVPQPEGTVYFGVTVSPLDEATRGGVICLFSDLTSVVEMEDRLRLKEALARLGELTAGLAHEFRNGLATIHGYARLLDPALLPDHYQPYVESLRVETDQLGRIVTNFLDFAKPEPFFCARVSLQDVARRAAVEVQRDLPAGEAIRATGEFGDVEGDEQLLKQVFDNLIRNAIEACRGAGTVPAIVVHGEIDHQHRTVHVYVDDNGPGIPEPERTRVFQPFFTTRSAGTGLGLSIVLKIVLAHNGRVTVTSSPRWGARFDLMFPLAPRRRDSDLNTAA